MVQTSTVVKASVATAAAGIVGYAIYFDFMRRRSPQFRRGLRRNERRKARSEKEEAEAAIQQKRQRVKLALMQALAQGFPTDVSQKEAYFMEQVAAGETLSSNPDAALDAAMAFYKALKVYPTPSDLIRIYDQTVPKHVLDILAEIIALDNGLSSSSLFAPPRTRATPGSVTDVTGAVDSDPEEGDPEELNAVLADIIAAAAQEQGEDVAAEGKLADVAEEEEEAEVKLVDAEGEEAKETAAENVAEAEEEKKEEVEAAVEAAVETEEKKEEESVAVETNEAEATPVSEEAEEEDADVEVVEKETEEDEDGVKSLASSVSDN